MNGSMADKTTKDIWNDDDGEEAQPQKSHRLRRFLIFSLTLVAVLGVVLVAAWRDGTGFDALKRYFSYGSAAETVEYAYDASSSNRFAALDDTLVVLSDTALRLLDKDGSEVWSAAVQMKAPALHVGGGLAVAYDVGGTELYVVSPMGEELHLTADEEEPFIAANLNADGYLAVTAEKRTYKGSVHVYDTKMKEIFEFKSSNRFVTDAYVTNDNARLAAVTLGQENSVFVSNIVLYDLTATDPAADYDISNGLVLAIGQQEDRLVTVSDTCLTFADKTGEVEASYAYSGEYLREYDFSGEGFTALLLNRYQSGSVGRLVTVAGDGMEIAALDVNEEVRSLSAAGRYLAVLYMSRLVVYNQDLQEYAVLEDTDYVREVIVRQDGSALLISADSASLFLP
jgi:hypothetical protein